jgi:hypothetical protein
MEGKPSQFAIVGVVANVVSSISAHSFAVNTQPVTRFTGSLILRLVNLPIFS